jgi:ABC-type arginine transport system permease subunit
MILIGEIIIACGQPFFFNTIAALTNAWFGESERVMASTTLSNAIAVGNLLASLIPGLIFADEAKMSDLNFLRKRFTLYLIICSSIVSILEIPLLFVAKDAPPSPPSIIASKKEKPFEFKKELQDLMKNKNFLLVVASMTLTFSAYISFITN